MLHLHRSERADALVPPLAAVLAEPGDDVFAAEVVAVPTRGVERWLAQRLSHVLGAADGEAGVCAGVDFASPARLAAQVLARAGDLDPDVDPWRPAALLWTVLDVVDAAAAEPWAAALARHLGADAAVDAAADDAVRRGRRLGVARKLAGLFGSYGEQRPDLVLAWAAGRDEDGAGAGVPSDLAWQPRLWRQLRDRLGVPSPAERLAAALDRLRAEPAVAGLPSRVSVFGPTRLPADQLRLLRALAEHREVHLWLPHPCAALWDRVAGAGPQPGPAAVRRSAGRPLAAHPLLASMARDATELQQRLAAGPALVAHHPAPPPAPTLLGALQDRLRRDDVSSPPHQVRADDVSVRVHSCHGRARQVEVLREVVLGLLAADGTLEPRDVVVMCPDVETFAPLVAAAFGAAAESDLEPGADVHPGQHLRVRLADRSLRQTNPQLSLLATLLDLADGRVTASEVLDLAASEPVRRRFRFDDDDLDRLRSWAVATGVHWGEDRTRRERFGLGEVRQGTWDLALDRILLGAAMAEEDHRFVGPALPLDDVDSVEVDLAGRLAEFLDRLTAVLAALDGVQPLGHWLDALGNALDLLAQDTPTQAWQGVEARRLLADVRAGGAGGEPDLGDLGGLGPALRLADLRALLAGRLRGRPTRSGFRTGALTVCSLEPMRAVPHRVVVLLGMSDGTFPRRTADDGDDVLLRDPCLGERDRRSEDRQLFLDAVTAAQDHLVVLYSGADERTGAARPPAVPVAELLDALDRTGVLPDGAPPRSVVLVRHPLQPVDERNFVPGALGAASAFSFDRAAQRAALAGRGPRDQARTFLPRPLPPEPRADVALDDLVEVFEHPVRWFVRRRLQVFLPGDVEDVDDRVPLGLAPLAAWGIGDRVLAAVLDGVSPQAAIFAEWRRGQVPPRELGRAALVEIEERVKPVAREALPLRREPARVVDVSADLAMGTVVAGSVPGVHGQVVVRAVYSRLGAKHRLRAWVQLLALTAAQPEVGWTAVTIGRAPGRRPGAAVSVLRRPDPALAARWLEELVRLRDRAARAPLPAPPTLAAIYARSRVGGDTQEQAMAAVQQEWSGKFSSDRTDAYHVLCWGPDADLAVVAGEPLPDERSWSDDATRLGVLARRIWDPLLAHEGAL